MGKPMLGLTLKQLCLRVPQHTSLFSMLQNVKSFVNHLNSDLRKTSNWAFQWKISFNPDFRKEAQKVFSLEKSKRHFIL